MADIGNYSVSLNPNAHGLGRYSKAAHFPAHAGTESQPVGMRRTLAASASSETTAVTDSVDEPSKVKFTTAAAVTETDFLRTRHGQSELLLFSSNFFL